MLPGDSVATVRERGALTRWWLAIGWPAVVAWLVCAGVGNLLVNFLVDAPMRSLFGPANEDRLRDPFFTALGVVTSAMSLALVLLSAWIGGRVARRLVGDPVERLRVARTYFWLVAVAKGVLVINSVLMFTRIADMGDRSSPAGELFTQARLGLYASLICVIGQMLLAPFAGRAGVLGSPGHRE